MEPLTAPARLHDDEVVAFVTRAAEGADPVPLVLYNPPHAKTLVPPALLGRLAAAVPTLVGTKAAGGPRLGARPRRARQLLQCGRHVAGRLV